MTNLPTPTRPHMPGYGVDESTSDPGAAFPWSEVEALLVAARCYWVVTTHNGRPHAAPVWGAWLDDVLLFDSGRESKKTRNILVNPEIVVHLDGGENAVILEGRVERTTDEHLLSRLAKTYESKYKWPFDPENTPGIIFAFRPRVCLSWREELGETATRWRFSR